MKDNFSDGASRYQQFRPVYPQALYDFLLPLVREKDLAWDCATGNGQVAMTLASYFREVIATDISRQQMDQGPVKANIIYRQEPAESSSAPDHCFDLVTVAQAIHWLDFEAFYGEVRRTIKPGGILAVIGYGALQGPVELQALISDFYTRTTGPYWDAERRFIDELYQTIPFPFEDIPAPELSIAVQWNLAQLCGYLGTWSATKHYIQALQEDPVPVLEAQLKAVWADDSILSFSFPLLLRVARL